MTEIQKIRARLDKLLAETRDDSDPAYKAPTLGELKHSRANIVADGRAILDLAELEKRDLSGDEQKLFDRLIAEGKRFDLKIGEAKVKQEEQREAAARHLDAGLGELDGLVRPGASRVEQGPVFSIENGQEVRALLPGQRLGDRYPSEDRTASLGRMVRGMITNDWTGAEAERRAMGEGVGSLGGFNVPIVISANIIDLARNQSVLVQGGALTIPMTTGEMTIVRQVGDVTGEWREEHKKVTKSDATFEPIRLKATTLAALTRISIELMEDAPNFGGVIENAIAAALALEIDRAGILGKGVNEPRGIVETDGVNVVSMGTNGAALTNYDPFLDAIEKVDNNNGAARTVAYAPRTKRALAGLKTGIAGDQTPLTPPDDFTALQRLPSNQFPVNEKHGTATNASTALLGDYAQSGIAIRTGLVLEATRSGDADAFSQLEVLIRGYIRADVAVLRPAHFTKITGIKPA